MYNFNSTGGTETQQKKISNVSVSPFTVKKEAIARTPQILVEANLNKKEEQEEVEKANTVGKSANGFFCSFYNPEALTTSINPEDSSKDEDEPALK